MHPDQRYIEALLKNDHALIEEIYNNFSGRITSLIVKNRGNAEDARDIFQEALIAIHRNAQSGLILECPFEAYLYVVCKRKWLNTLKKNSRHNVTIRDLAGYEDAEVQLAGNAMQQLQTEREDLFWQVFQELGEKCRELLKLSWTGLAMQEVAGQMGMTYGYARRRKTLCTQQLMDMIRESPGFKHLKEL